MFPAKPQRVIVAEVVELAADPEKKLGPACIRTLFSVIEEEMGVAA